MAKSIFWGQMAEHVLHRRPDIDCQFGPSVRAHGGIPRSERPRRGSACRLMRQRMIRSITVIGVFGCRQRQVSAHLLCIVTDCDIVRGKGPAPSA